MAPVDSNVLLDIATDDPVWSGWSASALRRAGRDGRLVNNPIIYAELSVSHGRIETLDALLPQDVFHREPLPWVAAFLAGKAFRAYCQRGGARHSLLPDFYTGGHAAIAGYRLLTRDRGRYATCYPTVGLISPQ